MNKTRYPVALLLIFLYACHHKPSPEKEEGAIRQLLEQERTAHFNRDSELFISEFADSMIQVNRGVVSSPTKKQQKERIGRYFGSVEFDKWDDTAEPLIRFSADGSLAYAIIQKEVIINYPDSMGNRFYDTAQYAWVSIYRKQAGSWKIECNISTNK